MVHRQPGDLAISSPLPPSSLYHLRFPLWGLPPLPSPPAAPTPPPDHLSPLLFALSFSGLQSPGHAHAGARPAGLPQVRHRGLDARPRPLRRGELPAGGALGVRKRTPPTAPHGPSSQPTPPPRPGHQCFQLHGLPEPPSAHHVPDRGGGAAVRAHGEPTASPAPPSPHAGDPHRSPSLGRRSRDLSAPPLR